MGEVYRARDQHLERDVALKTLAPDLSHDSEAVARFEREAKTASALNHPHIVHIYDIGEATTPSGSTRYIAMELVAGETLRVRLQSGDGWARLLNPLIQVGDALAAAHRAGVIHRDLKPENIMITADGYAKIVDFGLAKLTEVLSMPNVGEGTSAPTRAPGAHTRTGTIVGTVGYMSPEQAQGLKTDARSDVFSLGCILYEVLAGCQPFKGASALATLHAILYDEPAQIESVNARAPLELCRIAYKCLRKNPVERYQLVANVANDLRAFNRAHPTSPDFALTGAAAGPTPNSRRVLAPRRIAWSALALAIGVGAAIGLWKRSGTTSRAVLTGASALRVEKLTSRGWVSTVAISPDGRYLAYVVPEQGRSVLWLRDLVEKTEKRLVDSAEPFRNSIRFASDGRSVYYLLGKSGNAESSLYRAPLVAGEPRLIRTARALSLSPDDSHVSFVRRSGSSQALVIAGVETGPEIVIGDVTGGRSLGWSHDGKHLLYRHPVEVGHGLFVVNNDGTGSRRIASVPHPPVHAWWSSDGAHAILDVAREPRGVQLVSLDTASGATTAIGDRPWSSIEDLVWLPGGRAFVVSDFPEEGMSLWRVSYPDGTISRVPDDSRLHYRLGMTTDGTKLVTTEQIDRPELLVSTTAPHRSFRKAFSGTNSIPYDVCWTPDGRIIFSSNEAGTSDLYVINADGSGRRQLTFDQSGNEVEPAATRDGRYVVFASDRSGDYALYRINADGGPVTELTSAQPGQSDRDPHVTPDGRWIVYRHVVPAEATPTLWKVSIEGGTPTKIRSMQATAASERNEEYAWGGSFSPDGRQLAFFRYGRDPKTRQSSRVELAVSAANGEIILRFPIREIPAVRSNEWIQWSADGQHLYYVSEDSKILWKHSVSGGIATEVARSEEGFADHEFSADGKSLAFSRSSRTRDVVLISNLH